MSSVYGLQLALHLVLRSSESEVGSSTSATDGSFSDEGSFFFPLPRLTSYVSRPSLSLFQLSAFPPQADPLVISVVKCLQLALRSFTRSRVLRYRVFSL